MLCYAAGWASRHMVLEHHESSGPGLKDRSGSLLSASRGPQREKIMRIFRLSVKTVHTPHDTLNFRGGPSARNTGEVSGCESTNTRRLLLVDAADALIFVDSSSFAVPAT